MIILFYIVCIAGMSMSLYALLTNKKPIILYFGGGLAFFILYMAVALSEGV